MALHISCMTGLRPTIRSLGSLVGQHGRDAHEPGGLEGPLQDLAQSLEVDRLDEIIERPAFHGLDGRLRRAVGRDEDDRPFRVVVRGVPRTASSPERSGSCKSSTTTSGSCSRANRSPSAAVCSREHGIGVAAENAAERVADAFIVVDDQHRAHAGSLRRAILKCDGKASAALGPIGRGQCSAMLFDDAVRQRKPEARPSRLIRSERREDLFSQLGSDAGP